MNAAPKLMHVFSTFCIGGPQVRFAAIANHFGDKYRHAVLAMDGKYDAEEKLDSGIRIEKLEIAAPKKRTLQNVIQFRNYLRRNRPDVLVTYNWGALEWALANRPQLVPHIHFEDGFGPEEAEAQLSRRVLARRFALRRSTIVVPSLNLKRIALQSWRLPAQRVRYIPNGVDCARFAAARNDVVAPPGTGPVIGTVATLRKEKNIERLIRAFAEARRRTACRLVIAGDGPERENLQQYAHANLPADSFVFTGHVNQVENIYAGFDIFALSSDTEQMPTSLMEAMAAGLAVVSTAVGDVPDMITEENRPFVVAKDDDAFCEALVRLAADEPLRARLGETNRKSAAERFGLPTMLATYDALFSQAAGR